MNKNEILPFFPYVDGPRDYYAKWNKRVKDEYGLILLICGIWKENKAVNIKKKKKKRLTDIENKLVVISGKRPREGHNRGVGWRDQATMYNSTIYYNLLLN